ARRQDHPDLRGHQRDPAVRDRSRDAQGLRMTVKQLFVAGAGLMGAGIAQTAISCGYEVSIREVDESLVGRGVDNIKKRLESLVQKGKLEAGKREAATN